MNKIIYASVFLVSIFLFMPGVNAAINSPWLPGPFDFIHFPSMNCGTCETTPQNGCGNYKCILGTCMAAYAPEATVCIDDNNPCTADTCDGSGACNHATLSGNSCTTITGAPGMCFIGNCVLINGNCASQPKCYNDNGIMKLIGNFNYYSPGGCIPDFASITTCNDNNVCTTDSCDNSQGCVYTPINFDDGNACTIDSCNFFFGATHTARTCDDNDPLTTDTCDAGTGCVLTPLAPIDPQVPEFGLIAGAVALAGLTAGVVILRKKD